MKNHSNNTKIKFETNKAHNKTKTNKTQFKIIKNNKQI